MVTYIGMVMKNICRSISLWICERARLCGELVNLPTACFVEDHNMSFDMALLMFSMFLC